MIAFPPADIQKLKKVSGRGCTLSFENSLGIPIFLITFVADIKSSRYDSELTNRAMACHGGKGTMWKNQTCRGRWFPRASKQYFNFKRKSLWKIHYHSMQPVLLQHPSPHWLIRSTPKLAIAAGHQLVPATTQLSSKNSSAAASTCHLSVMGIPFRLPIRYSWQATAWSQ